MQSENNEHEHECLARNAEHSRPGMSDAWRELLGLSNEANQTDATAYSSDEQPSYSRALFGQAEGLSGERVADPGDHPGAIPALTNDPWAELQHEQGIEIFDLQQVRSQALNDLDLEQVLQCMREQPTPGDQEK